MKKTKTIRYKRQEDVKLDDFGNLTTKTVAEKMTEKEHRKLFKETALQQCSKFADNACKEIILSLSDFNEGLITFEQAMKIVAHAKRGYLKNVEENKIEDFISHFDVVNIWKNKVSYLRKMYNVETRP